MLFLLAFVSENQAQGSEKQRLTDLGEFITGSLNLKDANNKGPSFDGVKDSPLLKFGLGFILHLTARRITKSYSSREIEPKYSFTGNASSNNNNYFTGYNNLFSNEKEKLIGYFYFSAGLEFNLKGTIETNEGETTNISLYYLQLPVLINYSYVLSEAGAVHFGIGPYAAAGLFGSFNTSGMKQTVHFGSSQNNDFKRMDYGLAIDAGVGFLKKWDATLNYDLGIRNVSATPPDPDTHIRGFSLRVGYRIK